jgi:methylenetetrahydrofolate dehydrogenase (NADP+)/methenyltetrahydrofolate cyclohydrolase
MIIDGSKIASTIKKDIKKRVRAIKKPLSVSLVVIAQGEVGEGFVATKSDFGKDVGVAVNIFSFDGNEDKEVIKLSLARVVRESEAVVIQLPLPKHLDSEAILNLVPLEKDPDMLSVFSREKFFACKSDIVPPVAGAVAEILASQNVYFKDKKIVVIGNGRLVGAPVAGWFACNGVIPIVLEKGDNLQKELLDADIIVSGAGVAALVKFDMIKEGVILIDAGTSGQSGQVVGDIDSECAQKASLFTPVPGGVGPITVAKLFENFINLMEKSHERKN